MTIKKYNIYILFFMLLSMISLSSCFSTNRSYPEKNFYVLDISRNSLPLETKKNYVIEVRQFLSPYTKSGKEFVYKFPDGEYKSDFYNAFFVQPNKIIKEETKQWLEDSGLFKTVVDSRTSLNSDLFLEGNIEKLYADFSGREIKSVLGIQFFITKNVAGKYEPFFHKNYKREIIVKSKSPKDLVVGWNKALEEILAEFEKNIAEHNIN